MQIELNGTTVSYDILGSGPDLLLVHGWGGRKESLRTLAELLSKSHRCYILDLPGHGGSSVPKDNWGSYEYSNLVEQFINKVFLAKPVFVGHSFGGAIGVILASNKNSKLSKLVLIAAAYNRSKQVVDPTVARLQRLPFYKQLKGLSGPMRKIYYKVRYPLADVVKKPELESIVRNIVTKDLTHHLEDIDLPTLILWGSEDRYTDVEDAKLADRIIENSDLSIYEGAGHDIPMKMPDWCSDKINDFING